MRGPCNQYAMAASSKAHTVLATYVVRRPRVGDVAGDGTGAGDGDGAGAGDGDGDGDGAGARVELEPQNTGRELAERNARSLGLAYVHCSGSGAG